MLNFAQADFLLLLLLIPIFFILYAVMRRMRARRLARFGDPEQVSRLMPSVSSSKGWVRISIFSLAFFFFVVGLSRPQIGAKLKEHKTKGV
ncbi:MAG: BatA domain-containing protein, partial [Bacteroidales bacterium]|nr:BatA domain-containing protein [Candidatus Cryptobacteroides caccocaballi]